MGCFYSKHRNPRNPLIRKRFLTHGYDNYIGGILDTIDFFDSKARRRVSELSTRASPNTCTLLPFYAKIIGTNASFKFLTVVGLDFKKCI